MLCGMLKTQHNKITVNEYQNYEFISNYRPKFVSLLFKW